MTWAGTGPAGLTASIGALTARVKAARVGARAIVEGQAARVELRVMSNLTAVADRIKAKRALYVQKAEEWSARLDKLDALEPVAFAAADATVTAVETDLTSMEADMRVLTNLPPEPVVTDSKA
jgi:hypothetical protein